MQQIEVVSWKTLNALKQAATIEEIIGDLDTNEQMAVFCSIEEDYLELYFSELESNYIRHYEDEEEFLKYIETRKNEFGEEDFDSMDYYEDEGFEDQDGEDDYAGYKIKDEDEEEDF